jgi:hypothetical protein
MLKEVDARPSADAAVENEYVNELINMQKQKSRIGENCTENNRFGYERIQYERVVY